MSPSARLIGYYIDNNGRVVADSILLKVEDTLPTKVIKTPVRFTIGGHATVTSYPILWTCSLIRSYLTS